MHMKNILPKLGATLLVIVGLASCEEEFSNIDTDIIEQTFETEMDDSKSVIAYSKSFNGVQSNDLSNYQLGVYNDPVYGKSTVNLISQLQFANSQTSPTFGDCVVLDSVILYLPFFSTATVVSDEETTYEVDSIYGSSPINIEIFESNYLLRTQDPNTGFEDRQIYYSNQQPEFEGFLGELLATVDDFVPTSDPVVLNDTVSLAPGLRVSLPVDFFQEKIIDNEGEPELLNNNNFKEFFRGLYFRVNSPTDDGSLFMFDLADTDDDEIGVKLYSSYKSLEDGETCETDDVEVLTEETRLFFNAISVNVFDNETPQEIVDATNNANTTVGEETLYVRGGEGIVTFIELFGEDADGDGVADELDELRSEEWLINEANLVFYVDQDKVTGGDKEPERLFLYETANNQVLADYSLDLTSNQEAVNAVSEHLGRLERGSDDNGEFYKIKITNHLSNLINRDSINAPLALVVSQNVSQLDFKEVEDQLLGDDNELEVPGPTVISPEGTVLHGNRSSNVEKRLKLQIFFTKPE